MKLQELTEASRDFTPSVQEYKQSKEFEDVLQYFDYVSTKIQEKNGNLYFVSKPEIMKRSKDYKIAYSGEVSTKNSDGSIWGNIKNLPPIGVNLESERVDNWKKRSKDLLEHFFQWARKREKSKTEISNRNLETMVPLLLPEHFKSEAFSCVDNKLKDLIGGPISGMKYYYATNNELISPLKGAPEKVEVFHVSKNKLTTFEGMPIEMAALSIGANPIIQISGISKHIKILGNLYIDFIDNVGYLDLFKIKDFSYINFGRNNMDNTTKQVFEILNKHLKSEDKDILECQEELITNGLRRFAKI
jgi:hypothetical protein